MLRFGCLGVGFFVCGFFCVLFFGVYGVFCFCFLSCLQVLLKSLTSKFVVAGGFAKGSFKIAVLPKEAVLCGYCCSFPVLAQMFVGLCLE